MGQEFKSDFVDCFWLKVSHEIIFKILARAAVTWRFDWGWRIHSQDGSHTWLASWRWLLARGLVIIHASLSPGLLSVLTTWIPDEWSRESNEEEQCFLCLHLETHTPWFPQYPIDYICQPYSMWEGAIQRHGYQESRITQVHSEGWLPSSIRSPFSPLLAPPILSQELCTAIQTLTTLYDNMFKLKLHKGRDSICLVQQPAQAIE